MMDNSGGGWQEERQARPKTNWAAVVGVVAAVVALLVVVGLVAWGLGWFSGLGSFSGWSTPEVIELNPSVSSDETVSRQYEWSYEGDSFRLTLQIPEDLHDYYTRMERAPIEDYSIYVTHPGDDAELVDPLAAELKRLAVQKTYDSEETVNFAARFVQNLEYRLEDEEYPNYPVETLFDKEGDCEDTSVLTAALLRAMGYDAVLIRFSPVTGAGHMAVGVVVPGVAGGYSYTYDGKKYYYLETTSASWGVGDMPPEILSEYGGQSNAIYKLERIPVLRFADFAWRLSNKWVGTDTVYLETTVNNWGTASADDFHVKAFFEGHEDDAKESDIYDLAYGYQISGVATKSIALPSGGGTLCVELWLDGEVVDDWSVQIS